ncbi:rho guanine nucleotide exchange factor 17-like isoform X2 [Salvelinus sp. IW2-2015]|uniref:rho guanine nucleotide exchange factor 17-like isoform X2 n=1 Tax=Salvelinus sp. IW2-2015 TaxID=2691554 RepID=UPI0038D45976
MLQMVRTLAQFSIALDEMQENGENTSEEGRQEREEGGGEELMDRDAADRHGNTNGNASGSANGNGTGNTNRNGTGSANGNGNMANGNGLGADMRRHVMMTLLDTEQSYVESLRTLIQGYMRPLKQPDSGSLVDPSLVDEMFYQIPEILEHHEHFLEQVTGCISQWHDRQTVGQLLIQSFSKEILANIYSAYIDNFLNAKDAVRIAKEAKPAFLKFLEVSVHTTVQKFGVT